jgi:hypothetical protein
MKLRLVPARQGAAWVRYGLRVFFRRPLAYCLLFGLCLFLAPVLLFAAAPITSLGFIIATAQVLQGGFPLPGVFFEPLRSDGKRLRAHLLLCVGYAAGFSLVFWAADAVGGEAFDAFLQAMRAGKTSPQELEPLLGAPGLQSGRALLLGGLALLSIPFWHAPALVHWGGLSAPKALFFSTVAWWRNKGALVVYGLTWLAVGSLFFILVTLVFSLLGQPQLVVMAIMPSLLMFYAAFYASLYFTFADCFEPPPGSPSTETSPS